jgi:hypothetical protein
MNWEEFLRREFTGTDNSPIQTHKWVEYVVRDGILPLLKATQFGLICKPQELANCILNHLIRHERDFLKSRFTSYRCKHPEEMNLEEYEYFEDMVPSEVWASMRRKFYLRHFADDSEFAARIWLNIPFIVFEHLDINTAGFNGLYEKQRHLDEEEDSENELLGPGMGSERE